MNRAKVVDVVYKASAVIVAVYAFVIGGLFLSHSLLVLTDHSWYMTLKVLGPSYLQQMWLELAVGFLLWSGLLIVGIRFMAKKRRQAE